MAFRSPKRVSGKVTRQRDRTTTARIRSLGVADQASMRRRRLAGTIGPPNPPNILLNSVWAGASGSVGGADWVPPTSWSNGFWPPDEAIALPGSSGKGDTGVEFLVVGNRGYLNISLDTTLEVGNRFNLSIYVDEVITGGAYANVSGGNVTIIRGFPTISNGFVGRVDAVYEITGISMAVRFGGGVTSSGTSQFTLSRPQLTIGERLYPYEQT